MPLLQREVEALPGPGVGSEAHGGQAALQAQDRTRVSGLGLLWGTGLSVSSVLYKLLLSMPDSVWADGNLAGWA